MADWFTVYRTSDGSAVTTGNVVADPLPPGLAKVLIAGQPRQQRWNPSLLIWEPRPIPDPDIDRVDEFVARLDAAVNVSNPVEKELRNELDILLGLNRFRDSEDSTYELEGPP